MSLKNLVIYSQSEELADRIAAIVEKWEAFHKHTLGSQIVRAADSVSNNIAEGYGRLSIGERLQFYLYAEGSAQETRNCLRRAHGRSLISHDDLKDLSRLCTSISIGVIELAFRQLEREPTYSGHFRKQIERRRDWLVKKRKDTAP